MCPLTRGQLSGRVFQQLLLSQLLPPSQNRRSLQTHMSPTGSGHDPTSLPPWPLRTQQKQHVHSHHSHHLPQGRPETLRLTEPPPQGTLCSRCRTHTGLRTNLIKLCWPHLILHLFPNTCSAPPSRVFTSILFSDKPQVTGVTLIILFSGGPVFGYRSPSWEHGDG